MIVVHGQRKIKVLSISFIKTLSWGPSLLISKLLSITLHVYANLDCKIYNLSELCNNRFKVGMPNYKITSVAKLYPVSKVSPGNTENHHHKHFHIATFYVEFNSKRQLIE